MAASKQPRLNEDIDAKNVRLIGSDGEQVGIVSIEEANAKAGAEEMDLVEIVPNAEPPVCRLMNYGKYRFEQKKKAQEARKNQKVIHIKEIKFRPGTDEGDYQIKLNKLTKFLEAGDKTKVTVRFRGREMAHKELGLDVLKRVQKDLNELAMVEQFPKSEGRQMVMMLTPRKK